MTAYTRHMQELVEEYRASGGTWPASPRDLASWAIKTKRWEFVESTALQVCAEHFAQAMREEYITDEHGRRVRAKHAVRKGQTTFWDDIRTAPREHMEVSLQQRRNGILSDCRQLKTDADSWNDGNPDQLPIPLVFDFTNDLAELEAGVF